ncbi:MAG TPA: hypothetical protein VFX98_12705, partial [Longimicrobiaceae bacterium]|nr:hypothetical protein [Longimicrobiaceae bacterium]
YRRVVTAPEGAYLRLQGAWGEGAVLVGEFERPRNLARFAAYDTRTWERRPLPLPVARQAVPHDLDRVALLAAPREGAGDFDPVAAVHLWRGERAEPLEVVRGRELHLAWSPDGRRLLVTRRVTERVPDLPGATRSPWRTHLLESTRD